MIQMNLQNRNRLTDFNKELAVSRGKYMGKGVVREFGMSIYTLLYLKWIANKDLLYGTWNSAQYYVPGWMGGEFGGEGIYVYV